MILNKQALKSLKFEIKNVDCKLFCNLWPWNFGKVHRSWRELGPGGDFANPEFAHGLVYWHPILGFNLKKTKNN